MIDKEKMIYFDHAATTALDEEVLSGMIPYMTEFYGNANSTHGMGRLAVKGLDYARETVASLINCDFDEVYFTSGGSEGGNWAVKIGELNKGNRNNVVCSSIEHVAMLSPIKGLEKSGVETRFVKPDNLGVLRLEDFEEKVDNNTFLVSAMLANNEIGTIEPIKEISSVAKRNGALMFTDAVQGIVDIRVDVKVLNVDMLSASAHKFSGPKGVGFMYIKKGTKLSPLIMGGHQERGKRGGTSNVAGAVGLALALKKNYENLEDTRKKVSGLRDYFVKEVLKAVPFASLNGSRDCRLSNNANITFHGLNGESLLMKLDMNGICASLGAACSAGSIEPSYVLKEIGLGDKDAMSTIRFTFGKENTFEEIDYCVKVLKEISQIVEN